MSDRPEAERGSRLIKRIEVNIDKLITAHGFLKHVEEELNILATDDLLDELEELHEILIEPVSTLYNFSQKLKIKKRDKKIMGMW